MTKNSFMVDVPLLTRNWVGIDSLFNELRDRVHSNYPPHNIYKVGENYYEIEVAVAGFDREDIQILVQDAQLVVVGNREHSLGDREPIYQGLAKRSFRKVIALAPDIEVLCAKLELGILTVKLERVIPDQLKPKQITIL